MAPRSSDPRPILCAVLDAGSLGPDAGAAARELFAAGVDWIQLRDRTLEADALFALARALVSARDDARAQSNARPVTRSEAHSDAGPDTRSGARLDHRTCVILNRRVDVACAADADGVHLGFDALGPQNAARLLPSSAHVGASLHSVDEIRTFGDSTTSIAGRYVHLAPIWDPLSKPASRPALGAERLAEACELGVPVLAQGGIDATTAAEAVRAGAAGVAVTGILQSRKTRIEHARQLRAALDGKNPPRG